MFYIVWYIAKYVVVFQAERIGQCWRAKTEGSFAKVLCKRLLEAEKRKSDSAFEKVLSCYKPTHLCWICHCILGCRNATLLPKTVAWRYSNWHWKLDIFQYCLKMQLPILTIYYIQKLATCFRMKGIQVYFLFRSLGSESGPRDQDSWCGLIDTKITLDSWLVRIFRYSWQ